MFAGRQAVADDRVLVDSTQPRRLSDTAGLGKVFQDRDDFLLGQSCVEEGCAFAFGKACLAGFAAEHPVLFVLAVACADGEIAVIAFAVVCAFVVLAAEEAEVFHED